MIDLFTRTFHKKCNEIVLPFSKTRNNFQKFESSVILFWLQKELISSIFHSNVRSTSCLMLYVNIILYVLYWIRFNKNSIFSEHFLATQCQQELSALFKNATINYIFQIWITSLDNSKSQSQKDVLLTGSASVLKKIKCTFSYCFQL